jgi:hypothetical protein
MLYLTPADVQSGLIAFVAVFFMLQFTGYLLFIDTGLIVLHFAFLAAQIYVGVFSAWHRFND